MGKTRSDAHINGMKRIRRNEESKKDKEKEGERIRRRKRWKKRDRKS